MSGSMEPELSINDLLFVKEAGDYAVGDMIVYQKDGMSVVHRIMEINGDEVITKGDANNTEDSPILKTRIEGKVVGKSRFLGEIVRFVKTPTGTIFVVSFAILILNISYMRENESQEKVKKEKRK